MDFQNLNEFFFSSLKNYIKNEMTPDYTVSDKMFLNYFSEKNKTDILKFIISQPILNLIENQLYEGFDECKFRINLNNYHDCEIIAISHSLTTQTIKQIKFFTEDLMFLTIRPPEDMRVEDFKEIIDKLLNKDIITGYIGVWEQKGISYSTLGQGKHVHIILKFNFNQAMKSHRQQIKEFLKKFKLIFDIGKTSLKKQFIIDKLYYMGLVIEDDELVYNTNLKYKKSAEKIKCLEYDRIFVKNNNLEILQKEAHTIISLTKLEPPHNNVSEH